MEPTPVNGMVLEDQAPPQPSTTMAPLEHGQIQTADFMASGNLRALYDYLKDMFDPKIVSQSGPIKPLTQAEIDRQAQKPKEDFVNSIPLTTGR